MDQSFVQAIRGGVDDACIVNAIVAMAHGLKLKIVAEGVETENQLQYLRTLGCQQVQGFFYGPAQPASDINKLLTQTTVRYRPIWLISFSTTQRIVLHSYLKP